MGWLDPVLPARDKGLKNSQFTLIPPIQLA
jgi:hypothetical protein